jgi:hypothetical protein
VLLPPEIPSTVHVAPPPPGTVAVNCCVCDNVRAAVLGDTLIVVLEIATVAVTGALVPPGPVQVREYDVLVVRAPVL